MNDITEMLNLYTIKMAKERSETQLILGELIQNLTMFPRNMEVVGIFAGIILTWRLRLETLQ